MEGGVCIERGEAIIRPFKPLRKILAGRGVGRNRKFCREETYLVVAAYNKDDDMLPFYFLTASFLYQGRRLWAGKARKPKGFFVLGK